MVGPVAAAVKQVVEMPEVVYDRSNRNGWTLSTKFVGKKASGAVCCCASSGNMYFLRRKLSDLVLA